MRPKCNYNSSRQIDPSGLQHPITVKQLGWWPGTWKPRHALGQWTRLGLIEMFNKKTRTFFPAKTQGR